MKSIVKTWVLPVVAITLASSAAAQTTFSGPGPWRYQGLSALSTGTSFKIDLQNTQLGYHFEIFKSYDQKMTLYARRGAYPTVNNFDYKLELPGGTTVNTFEFKESAATPLDSGTWYFCFDSLDVMKLKGTISRSFGPSPYSGMGAVVRGNGTTFRTFAPFASQHSVAGQFNNWSPTASPLYPDNNGTASVFQRGATAGQQYKYVFQSGANTFWKRDAYSRWVTNSVGNSRILDFSSFTWSAQNYNTPAWDEMVIYEMHIGTFNDVPGGSCGTFTSAIQKLDALQELGVNAVQLMPIQEFPGDFSWGYNPSDPYSVESAYGGPQGFQQFVDACHSRGIAVLLDLVHNHYGPTDLDLWRYDGWGQGSWGGIFFYNDNRAQTPWGDTRPDYGRGEVRQYVRDNAMMWAQDYRVDGFRWDSVLNMRTTNWGDNPDGWSLLQWINDSLDGSQPWKINIAEDLQGNEWITKSTGAGGAGFDSQWTPSFVHPMRPVMTSPNDGDRNMNDVLEALGQNYNGQWLQRIVYTESHDEVANGRSRVPQEIDPGNPGSWYARKRSTLGAVTTLTAPGIPMLFQGQEMLEDGYFSDNDPLDWTKANTYSGIRLLYSDLIKLRRNMGGQTAGLRGPNLNVFHVNQGAKTIAYHRWKNGGAGDDVVVLANWSNTDFADYRIGLPRAGRWSVIFNSDWNGYSADYANTFVADADTVPVPMHGLAQSAGFRLPPYTAIILVQHPGTSIAVGSKGTRGSASIGARG